jgi:hypothetical protein
MAVPNPPNSASPSNRRDSWPFRLALATVGLLVVPMTRPAWWIEAALRRRRGSFDFDYLNSTPYFACWGLVATSLVVWTDNLLAELAGLYALSLMEIVALGVSLMIAVARPGRIQRFMLTMARRRHPGGLVPVTVPTSYGALVALSFSTWYFACVNLFLDRHFAGLYTGVENRGSSLSRFWEFLYYSFTTVTTLGGRIQPDRFGAEMVVVLEVTIGIFFFLFLLGTLVARYLDKVQSRP